MQLLCMYFGLFLVNNFIYKNTYYKNLMMSSENLFEEDFSEEIISELEQEYATESLHNIEQGDTNETEDQNDDELANAQKSEATNNLENDDRKLYLLF